MSEQVMTAAAAGELLSSLDRSDVRCWVMGGWGVDALLGRQTRDHHDLDLLVHADDLPDLHSWLRERGFARSYEWKENRPVQIGRATWDTAFVEQHPDGHELDVHAVRVDGGEVRIATADPWNLPPDTLDGHGRIDGRDVTCASASGQRAMHVGYELPDKQVEDLARLDAAARRSH